MKKKYLQTHSVMIVLVLSKFGRNILSPTKWLGFDKSF